MGIALPIEPGRRSISDGRQVRGAERFGQAVHEEYGASCGSAAAQLRECRARHRAAGIRDVAEGLAHLGRPFEVGELRPERRHAGQAGHALALRDRENVAREQVVHQHDGRADRERGRQLAEPVVEAEGQHGEQPVVGRVLEVLRDAVRAGHHVPVRQHDAFRPAGAARGVEDRHHVHVDDAMKRRAGREPSAASRSTSPARGVRRTAAGPRRCRRARRTRDWGIRAGRARASRSAPGEVTSTRTSQSPRMCRTCGAFRIGLTGTKVRPARAAPNIVTTVSSCFGRNTATRSCTCRPRASIARPNCSTSELTCS